MTARNVSSIPQRLQMLSRSIFMRLSRPQLKFLITLTEEETVHNVVTVMIVIAHN